MKKDEFDEVVGLAQFLWKNVEEIKKKGAKNESWGLAPEDKLIWNRYFKELILPGILPDGIAFGGSSNNTHIGVGTDGAATPAEYYQLLMQCYRYLYMALSSGEIYLKCKFWDTAEN